VICSIRNRSPGHPVAEHFNSTNHTIDDIRICGVKQCSGSNTSRKRQEMQLIFKLSMLRLSGLNINFSFVYVCSFHVHAFGLFVFWAHALPAHFSVRFLHGATLIFCTLRNGYARNVCAVTNNDNFTCLTKCGPPWNSLFWFTSSNIGLFITVCNNCNGSFSFIAGWQSLQSWRRAFGILEFLYSTSVTTAKYGVSLHEVSKTSAS